MRRSKWKGRFIDRSILRLKLKKKTKIKIWSRRSVIPAFLKGLTVMVHNGKDFKKVHITKPKIGYKFGEFVPTKKYTKKIKK